VYEITEEEARRWIGWNTALKPAYEPIVVARKPISEDTIAENVLKWGTGALNVDACRIELDKPIVRKTEKEGYNFVGRATGGSKTRIPKYWENNKGRYPANVVLDEEAAEMLDQQTGELKSGYMSPDLHKRNKTEGEYESPHGVYGKFKNNYLLETFGDKGGASRFFYCAKATKKERERGLEKLEPKRIILDKDEEKITEFINHHPTVKPITLMKYLVNLVTPPGGMVLDPFAGSGSTLIACKELGINYIGIEKEAEYVEIANLRLNVVPDKIPGL
jgi:site-specific DNA-methyltransferase (adenine-specific)